ncbi:MAG TPA: hypothetical protein VNT30_07810 [Stellaceae bacterium]|nr:hypothetical protein [Stellaceae bacterium]
MSAAVACVAGFAMTGAAHAFTIDTRTNQSSSAAALQDPDAALQGGSALSNPNKSGLHFFLGGSNTNNAPSNAESLFLPSSNSAMQSPYTGSGLTPLMSR